LGGRLRRRRGGREGLWKVWGEEVGWDGGKMALLGMYWPGWKRVEVCDVVG
jgi:hypothetical protein